VGIKGRPDDEKMTSQALARQIGRGQGWSQYLFAPIDNRNWNP
jgi:hypothetical protein